MASDDQSTARVQSWWAQLNAWIEDPIAIHVTETSINRTWDTAGGWTNVHGWGWYAPTDWHRLNYGEINSGTVGDTFASYENVAFCDPWLATESRHYTTRITTSPSSSVYNWSYSMDKWGDCAPLLSYHYALQP